jgi:hypothetical protein
MIDVNKITSTLAKLPDPQLQQYAQMHKNDPYIMALAMSESNRRKELRAASQGGQGMQEQPKVVDQMLAEMAPQQMPEDQGIGQLPAGEMNFASGGIIAFADGGIAGYDDADFVSRSEPVVMMAEGGVARYQVGGVVAPELLSKYQQELEEMGVGTRMQFSPDVKNVVGQIQAAQEAAYLKKEQQRMLRGPYADAAPAPAATATKKESPFEQERARNMARVANEGYTRGDPRALPTMPSGKEQLSSVAAPKVDAAPKADTTRRAGPPATPLATPRAATGPTDIDALQQKYFGQIDQEVGGLRSARAGLVAGIKDLAEQNLAATRADIEKRGDVYKGREERLAKQEKGLEGMGDRNMGLALLQAGAAMMSTPGGLGVALGKGVQVGSERYAAGLDKIEAAKSKFAEARDRLDDLRINRDDMNAKDIRAAEKEARESELKGKEFLYNGLVSDLGIKQKNVTAIFGAAANALETDKQIASAEGIAAMQERGQSARAGRNQQLEMLQALQADPKLMATYRTMQGKNEDVMGQYTDFLKANPALAMDPKAAFTQFLMTKSAFAQLGAPTVTDTAAGPLRKQP